MSTTPAMIFLALDIDGVLHRLDARTDADDPDLKPFAYLPRLEAVLRDYPDVRVVITSDWQKYHTLDELCAFFSADLRERVVGVSGRHLRDVEPGNRQRDVERYFAERGLHHAVWCAIDDDEQNYYPNAALVPCADGFREPEECVLRAALDYLGDDEIAIEELASAGGLRAPINRYMAMPPNKMTEDEVGEEDLVEAPPRELTLEERNRLDNADTPESLRPFMIDGPELREEIHAEASHLGVSEETIYEWLAQFAQRVGTTKGAAWFFLTKELSFFDKPRVPLEVLKEGDWEAVLTAYGAYGDSST